MRTSKADRFLAFLQQRAYDGVDMTAFTDTYTSMSARVREELRDHGYQGEWDFALDPERPFQHPAEKTIIPELLADIESGVRRSGLTKQLLPRFRPTFGVLPTGEVNAVTIKVPGADEYVVVLEAELLTFSHLLSKAIAPAFAITRRGLDLNSDRLVERIAGNQESAQRFSEAVLAYAQHGRPGLAPQYVIGSDSGFIAGLLAYGMEKFVIGHEYGHVVNGDLRDGTSREMRVLADQDVEAVGYSWQKEFRADQHGMMLSILSNLGRRNTGLGSQLLLYSSGGADLFFTAMDIMDRATSLLLTGDEKQMSIGSHPPAADRRLVLRESQKIFMKRITGDGVHDAEPLHQFSDCLELAGEQLWDRTRPLIARAHTAGIRPAANWRQVPAEEPATGEATAGEAIARPKRAFWHKRRGT
jgi:hypothetical protein